MRQLRHPCVCLGLFAAALAAAGCGQSELPKKDTYPTRGRLLIRGEPARFVFVRLEPEDPAKGMPAEGQTDGDGVFELRTYSNDDPDGAVPGRYRVVLSDARTAEATITMPKGAKPTLIPDELREQQVVVEVKEEPNDLEITVP